DMHAGFGSADAGAVRGDLRGVNWVDDQSALLLRGSGSERYGVFTLLQFSSDSVSQTDFNTVWGIDPDARQFVLFDGSDQYNPAAYAIYDLASGQTLPLFSEDFDTAHYLVGVLSDPLRVEIAPISERGSGWMQYAIYTLQVRADG